MKRKGKINRRPGQIRKIEKRRERRLPILLDTAKIRREYEAQYEKAEEKLARLRESWRSFEETDRPAYQRWFQISFGKELAEMRHVDEEIRLKALIVDRVHYERMASGVSFFNAYQRVLRDEDAYMAESRHYDQNPSDGSGQQYAHEPPDEEDTWDSDGGGFEEGDDEMYDALREMLGNLREAFFPHEDYLDDEIEDFMGSFRRGSRDAGKRLKEAYRRFCKIMHPDTGAVFDERSAVLWNDAQKAYEERDLDKLEALLAIAETGGKGFSPKTSCAQILDAIGHIEEETGSLEYEIRRAKKDPAWEFSSISAEKREKLKARLAGKVSQELSQMKAQFARLQAQIAKWENPPAPRGRKKQMPTDPPNEIQMEFIF